MPTARESLCCQEVGEVIQKANEYGDSITCIVLNFSLYVWMFGCYKQLAISIDKSMGSAQ